MTVVCIEFIVFEGSMNTYTNGHFSLPGKKNSFGVGLISDSYSTQDYKTPIFFKLSKKGKMEYLRILNGAHYTISNSVTKRKSIYVTGSTRILSTDNSDIFVAKYKKNGKLEFFKVIDGGSVDYGNFVMPLLDKNKFLLVGTTSGSIGHGGYDVFVIKFSNKGVIDWSKTIGSSDNEFGYSAIQDDKGRIFIMGLITNGVYNNTFIKQVVDGTAIGCGELLVNTTFRDISVSVKNKKAKVGNVYKRLRQGIQILDLQAGNISNTYIANQKNCIHSSLLPTIDLTYNYTEFRNNLNMSYIPIINYKSPTLSPKKNRGHSKSEVDNNALNIVLPITLIIFLIIVCILLCYWKRCEKFKTNIINKGKEVLKNHNKLSRFIPLEIVINHDGIDQKENIDDQEIH